MIALRTACLVAALVAAAPLNAWGRVGHRLVCELTIQNLPPEVTAWFKGQESLFLERSGDPDGWRHDRKEPPRHYLDAEAYGGPDRVPFEIQEALARLGTAAFNENGQVLWVIQDRLRDLVDAFKTRDPRSIALAAATLSHYVADLHVPLHTTDNHNGQYSGQLGIHSRWETGLVERYASLDSLEVRPATYEKDLFHAPWRWLKESHALVPKLLEDDRTADRTSRQDIHGKRRGEAYWAIMASLQGPAMREQLSRAGHHMAQLVMYAWMLAEKPKA